MMTSHPLTQDVQGQEPSSQAQDQVQGQESLTRIVTQEKATPQASTSRPCTRRQGSIEAQAQESTHREVQSSPIRALRLFENPNDEQANNISEDDGEHLPMQDTHITREQASAQAQDVGTPHLVPQQPQVKRVNQTLA